MSNHGSEMSPESRRHFQKMIGDLTSGMNLGATGDFPQGKVHPTDEGGLRMAIGHKDGKVFVAFGTPTEWIGLDKNSALALANCIIEHAAQL